MRNGAERNYRRIIDAYRMNSGRNTFIGYQRCRDAEKKGISGHEAYRCPQTPQSPPYCLGMSQFIRFATRFPSNGISKNLTIIRLKCFSLRCTQCVARASKSTKNYSFPSRLSIYVNYKRYFNDCIISFSCDQNYYIFSQTSFRYLNTIKTCGMSILFYKCIKQLA